MDTDSNGYCFASHPHPLAASLTLNLFLSHSLTNAIYLFLSHPVSLSIFLPSLFSISCKHSLSFCHRDQQKQLHCRQCRHIGYRQMTSASLLEPFECLRIGTDNRIMSKRGRDKDRERKIERVTE